MDITLHPKEQEGFLQAREGFNGLLKSDGLVDEFTMHTEIIRRGIHRNGAFKEKVENIAFAISRSERGIDYVNAEDTLRGFFKSIVGQSMNDYLQDLKQNAENLTDEQKRSAYSYAVEVGKMIETGNKLAFNRSFAYQAAELATQLNITDIAAKHLMAEQFEAVEGRDFHETMKQTEEAYYRPQIEAEKAERQVQREQKQQQSTRSPARRRSPG